MLIVCLHIIGVLQVVPYLGLQGKVIPKRIDKVDPVRAFAKGPQHAEVRCSGILGVPCSSLTSALSYMVSILTS